MENGFHVAFCFGIYLWLTGSMGIALIVSSSVFPQILHNCDRMDSFTDGDEIKTCVTCSFCSSIVLSPGNAVFKKFDEPVPLPSAEEQGKVDQETEFWKVDDIYKFTNVGFSKIVPKEIPGLSFIPSRYLACADCDRGPIGFCNDLSNNFVALSRVRVKAASSGDDQKA